MTFRKQLVILPFIENTFKKTILPRQDISVNNTVLKHLKSLNNGLLVHKTIINLLTNWIVNTNCFTTPLDFENLLSLFNTLIAHLLMLNSIIASG